MTWICLIGCRSVTRTLQLQIHSNVPLHGTCTKHQQHYKRLSRDSHWRIWCFCMTIRQFVHARIVKFLRSWHYHNNRITTNSNYGNVPSGKSSFRWFPLMAAIPDGLSCYVTQEQPCFQAHGIATTRAMEILPDAQYKYRALEWNKQERQHHLRILARFPNNFRYPWKSVKPVFIFMNIMWSNQRCVSVYMRV